MKPASKSSRLPASDIVARTSKNFVVKHRRESYLALTKKPNEWDGYGFGELAHFTSNLAPRFCKRIPSSLQYDKYVLSEIQVLTRSTECYIMHENRKLDGQWMDITEALSKILGHNLGAFIIIDNGDIIYHESEAMKERYLGVRRQFQ